MRGGGLSHPRTAPLPNDNHFPMTRVRGHNTGGSDVGGAALRNNTRLWIVEGMKRGCNRIRLRHYNLCMRSFRPKGKLMFDRKGTLAFTAILASCIAGGIGFSAWTVVASACVLMLISMSNHERVIARLGGGATAQASAMASTVMNAVLDVCGGLCVWACRRICLGTLSHAFCDVVCNIPLLNITRVHLLKFAS